MPIWEYIACPRCKAPIGVECVQRDPWDASDEGQHSDRIHAFMEEGELEARVTVQLESEDAIKEIWNGPIEYGFFATEDEVLSVLLKDD